MGGLLLRLKTWWETADRTQKLIAIFGSGLLVALLAGTFVFASRPKMSLVFSNLDPEDTGNVAMEVETMGIPVTYDPQGNVSVPSDKVAQVRAGLAMKGKLPKAGKSFASDQLKNMPFIVDPKVQSAELKGIEEGQLSEAIQFFDGVEAASVQVTPSVESPFEGDKKPAQANVTVSEKSGAMISQDEARAMANLVSSAIPGLDKTKVTIFTRSGRALWDGQEMEGQNNVAGNKLAMEKAEARKKREELQDALNSMLGAGNAIAMVDLTLNVDQVDEDVIEHHAKPIPVKKVEENATSNGSSSTPGGGAGLDSNNTADAPTFSSIGAGLSKSGYNVTQQQYDPEMWQDTTHKSIKHGVGDVRSMAITVLVNKTKSLDPTAVASIQTLADSYLGHAADQINFPPAKVVAYPFDTTQADAAKKSEAASASSGRMQQIISLLPIAALLIVAFMVIKSIGKLANRPMAMMAMAGGGPALSMSPGGGQVSNNLSPSSTKSLEGANRFVLPEIVKQKALEAGISEEQLHAAILEAGDAGISIEDIPSIKSKVNVPLEQIKKMANEKPEVVAMLVKSWLIEEGIRR